MRYGVGDDDIGQGMRTVGREIDDVGNFLAWVDDAEWPAIEGDGFDARCGNGGWGVSWCRSRRKSSSSSSRWCT